MNRRQSLGAAAAVAALSPVESARAKPTEATCAAVGDEHVFAAYRALTQPDPDPGTAERELRTALDALTAAESSR